MEIIICLQTVANLALLNARSPFVICDDKQFSLFLLEDEKKSMNARREKLARVNNGSVQRNPFSPFERD